MSTALFEVAATVPPVATPTPTPADGGGGSVATFLQSRGYKSLGYCPLRSNTLYRRQGGSGATLDIFRFDDLSGRKEPLWEVETSFTHADGYGVRIKLHSFGDADLMARLNDLEQFAARAYRGLNGKR